MPLNFDGLKDAIRLAGRLKGTRGRKLAISLQGGSLRLLLAEGQRIVNWAEIPFNPAFMRGGFIADRQGLGRMIKNAVTSKGFPPATVLAAFPGFQSVVRLVRLPNTRDIRAGQVLPREARRLMAFSESEQYLFWQRVGVSNKSQSFVALAVPKAPLHAFADTLKLAGLSPNHVELAPLCLARVLPEGHAIAACVESDGIDIYVAVDSVPSLIRSLWLGDVPLTMSSAPARLAEELAATISFYNDANPESPLSPTLAIHLAGGLATDEVGPAVAAETGHPVVPITMPVATPEGFPRASMAVNCGLLVG